MEKQNIQMLKNEIENFHTGLNSKLTLHIKDSKDRAYVHDFVRSFSNPKIISRTQYCASIILIQCYQCEHFNDIQNSKSMHGCYLSMPEDYMFTCEKCNEYNGFSGDYEDLADKKREGELRCEKYVTTDKVIILKEPFIYSKTYFNTSYRKHYRRK